MHQVAVDDRQLGPRLERRDQVAAHLHKALRARRREIEPAEEFLTARLGGEVKLLRGLLAGGVAVGDDGALEPVLVLPEAVHQRLEEGDASVGAEARIGRKDLARDGDARRLAAAGQELLGELDYLRRTALAARLAPLDEAAPALRDGREQVSEEGGH